MYVYIQSEPRLWTVGFFTPAGEWISERDYDSPSRAAERVHYLNGGRQPDPLAEALNSGDGSYKP